MYILDQAMRPVPYGIPGELYIGGDGVTKGYLNRPALTEERYVQNPFISEHDLLYRTGDEARYLIDGNIEYRGRLDSQVKIRGYRIELGEIESILNKHESVHTSVVTTHDVHAGDRRLVAYYVPDDDVSLTATDLRAYIRKFLPKYMMPQIFVELAALPKTPNGKVDVNMLPDPFDSGQDNSDARAEPLTIPETKLAQIWKVLLCVDTIRPGDNFFELGGHSLLAMQVISSAKQELHVTITLLDLVLYSLSDIVSGLDMADARISNDNASSSFVNKVKESIKQFLN